jgi:hypothetical protein
MKKLITTPFFNKIIINRVLLLIYLLSYSFKNLSFVNKENDSYNNSITDYANVSFRSILLGGIKKAVQV